MKLPHLEELKKRDLFEQTITLEPEQLKEAWEQALAKIDANLEVFTHQFPAAASKNNVYSPTENTDWTTGFWTGMLWLAYEMTGDSKYRNVAELQLQSFRDRVVNRVDTDTHDLGFLYSLSCVAAYKLTGDEEAKQTALMAAELLSGRYKEKGEFIQAWGSIHDPANYRLIIDCYLNLPLLYWATEATGNPKYCEMAGKHFAAASKTVIRGDASTYHTYCFDPETGEPVRGVTHQGYSDDSCWSRGQAWGIYGLPLTYIYLPEATVPDMFKRITNYYLNRLPEDLIPYWDLIFTSGDEERDSSAAAIAICGMLEMTRWLDDSDPLKAVYRNAALHTLNSLMDNYTTKGLPESNGLLLHGVYSKPRNDGVDECNLWGDYFYLEALVRCMKRWELYW